MLEMQVFLPEDMIIRQGEEGRDMYFITRGDCQVQIKDTRRVEHNVRTPVVRAQLARLLSEERTVKGQRAGDIADRDGDVDPALGRELDRRLAKRLERG